MGEVDRARLKVALLHHYAAQREGVVSEEIDALAAAMIAEDAQASDKVPVECARAHKVRGAGLGHAAFVAAQVRYIPAWTWAAQIALVALMGALAHMANGAEAVDAVKVAVGMLSAVTVLVGVPTVHASKRHGVAELECACPHNVASVLVARLIVLGCSSALAVALMVTATAASLETGVFDVALWAVPLYFLTCAGCLMALRLAPPSTAAAFCAVWTFACCAVLAVLANAFPDLYAHASLAIWAGAAAVAGTWLVHEVVMTCRAALAGLDVFFPHKAKTYN